MHLGARFFYAGYGGCWRNDVILYCHAGNLLGYPSYVDTGYFARQNSGMTDWVVARDDGIRWRGVWVPDKCCRIFRNDGGERSIFRNDGEYGARCVYITNEMITAKINTINMIISFMFIVASFYYVLDIYNHSGTKKHRPY